MVSVYRNILSGGGETVAYATARPRLVASGRWTEIAPDYDAAAVAAVVRMALRDYEAALIGAAADDEDDTPAVDLPVLLGTAARHRPEDFGAVRDCVVLDDAAIAEDSTTLTAASAGFTDADVDKTIIVEGAGLNLNANTLVTTIASVTNATTVVLAAAAAVTVTGARAVYGTDDTAAIQDAVDAAYAEGLTNGSYCGEVVLSAGRYMVAGPLQQGAPYYSNAQIGLPACPEADTKFTLTLRGVADAATFAHWNQTVPQGSGTVLHSALAGVDEDGTWGPPCCIGGPTAANQGGGFTAGFSNLLLVVDGVTVVGPRDPCFTALYASRIAQLRIVSFAALADRTPASMNSARPQNDQGLGLAVPRYGNNHYVLIESYACEGFYYGMTLSDHTTALRLVLVYCRVAMFALTGGANEHGISLVNVGVEACDTILEALASEGGRMPIWVGQLNTETGAGTDFIDLNDDLVGTINFTANDASVPTVSGCGNVRIIDNNRYTGAATAPAVPATTVALSNPFWRDALVHVAGGTVTGIAVDGQTLGVTSGAVLVPTGKAVTLTYSSAPTWKWTLL